MSSNKIYSINGPVITVVNTTDFSMLEMVYVGKRRLIGEVISMNDEFTTIQVYEGTTGLMPDEPVYPTGSPMCVTLGPGMLTNIFDGIQRPLRTIYEQTGIYAAEGINVPILNTQQTWRVTVKLKEGDKVLGGQIYATCPETQLIEHRLLIPAGMKGTVTYAAPNGDYQLDNVILKVKAANGKEQELTLCRKWPIRTPRPTGKRLPNTRPLITGQRIIDSLFPIAKGGTAAVPGGFGTGKTVTQHQLAKWCDADIIVYIGCGERGNEMTQVLEEFTSLVDPKSGKNLTDRTVLIANTSNMPVAAREASIYTGITIAEYYRDMGYHVAVMADSTSRWAEALREISGRLEEMPAEEGFPAYLPSRLSEFYERAGYVITLCGQEGSVSIIGAVSPQGADFSEPVTQNTKRFVRCFWALDKSLAYARHYPSINWTTSYSEYIEDLSGWYRNNIDGQFMNCRQRIMTLLQQESELMEIVKLIGSDVLPDDQKLTIEIARVIRVGFLQQNAYHKDDTYVPLPKQYSMMKTILYLYDKAKLLISRSIPISAVLETGLMEDLTKMKYEIANDDMGAFDQYIVDIDKRLAKIR